MEYPLIAKLHEVQANLAGQQIQLRSTAKPGRGMQASWLTPESLNGAPVATIGRDFDGAQFEHPKGGPLTYVYCPFGAVGDRLWVREKFFPMRYDWKELPGAPILYSDGFIRGREAWGETYQGTVPPVGHAWKGAVTMPREASRLLLKILSLRIERVQNITRSDIRAQGLVCPPELASDEVSPNYKDWYPKAWQDQWVSDYGAESWRANQWVWVIEIGIIEAPLAPSLPIDKNTAL